MVRVGTYGDSLVTVTAKKNWDALAKRLSWAPRADDNTRKAVRERENEQAIGGMRNPWVPVARNSGLSFMGRIVRRCFVALVKCFPEALEVADHTGKEDAKEPPEHILDDYKWRVRAALGVLPDPVVRHKLGEMGPL